jgi:hypothetical protein
MAAQMASGIPPIAMVVTLEVVLMSRLAVAVPLVATSLSTGARTLSAARLLSLCLWKEWSWHGVAERRRRGVDLSCCSIAKWARCMV